METTRLGRSELWVSRTSFGALPIQRIDLPDAERILRKAFDGGINFYDTARLYSDSEEKLGRALSSVRDKIILATKTPATDRKTLFKHLGASLKDLKTDYVDILQLHNPNELPDPSDPDSSYAGLLEAKRKGMVRFIGVACHRIGVACEAIASGLYETLQFPISPLSTPEELALIEQCRQADMGLIAMKALCGGLISDARAAFAFLRQFHNLVPIWGIQRERELDEFLALEASPPALDAELWAHIAADRAELSGDFCRGCGYCLPCPAKIPIPMAARMSLLLRRAPYQQFLAEEWQRQMRRIKDCTECGACAERCPYDLDTPNLLKRMLDDYKSFRAAPEA